MQFLLDHYENPRNYGSSDDADVVGQSDFSTKVVAMSKNPCEIKVEHIMTTKLRAVGLDSSFYECLELMDTNNISHLIILDAEGKYYGMLSWKDLKERK